MKNVSLGCSITANTSAYGSYTASRAVNGNLETNDGFLTDAFNYASPAILTMDLKTDYAIYSVNLKHIVYGGTRRCKNFELQCSNDNKTYETVISDMLLNNDDLQNFKLNTVTTSRYWRFVIKDNHEGFRDKGIGEIELIAIEQVYLLLKDNKYYTIDDSLNLIEIETLNRDMFLARGFKDISLVNKIDRTGYKLLACPIKDNKNIELEYKFNKPLCPVDRYDNFEIYRKHFM